MISLLANTQLKTFKPLEKVDISVKRKGTVLVTDGEGKEYFRTEAENTVNFIVGGALGRHNIRLFDEFGSELGKFSFKVICETSIKDDTGRFEELLTILHYTMCSFDENQSCLFNGKVYNYFVHWLRDHVHTMKGMKYFSENLKSAIELYRDSQREDGMIWDLLGERAPHRGEFIKRFEYDNFIRVVENGRLRFLRIPVENDVEYLYIEGIYYTWKATGDDGWMESMLESAIKAYDYSLTSPYRWSEKYRLLKRGFTIDTWDFQDDEDAKIAGDDIMAVYKDKTRFGIMHGDNTGFAVGCKYLAEMLEYTGKKEAADKYAKLGLVIKERLDKLAWNGRFYTHHIPENDNVVRDLGVDQSKQLSLSNAYALNRYLNHGQCVSIIKEYINIKNNLPYGSPGEWYSIYPPFERGFETACKKWEYVNGGVTPIVAGELARGAFENGYEEYGVDILDRLHSIGAENEGFLDCCLKGAQSEQIELEFTPLDITEAANTNESVPGWTGERRNEYNEIPAGNTTLKGIPFIIPEPSVNGGKSCIGLLCNNPGNVDSDSGVCQIINGKNTVVRLQSNKNFKKEAVIFTVQKARFIYLLHTMTGNGLAGDVTLEFEDGITYSKYINEKKEILNWWLPDEPEYRKNRRGAATIAWEGSNHFCGRAAVSLYALENPRPECKISKIIFNAARNNNYWAILGVTLADNTLNPVNIKSTHSIPENWGAAAVTYALIEGLAGVVDGLTAFEILKLSPRWPAAGVKNCSVMVKYPSSGGYAAYEYSYLPDKHTMEYIVTGSGKQMECRLLLPKNEGPVKEVKVGEDGITYEICKVEESEYAVFRLDMRGVEKISVLFV